MTLSMQIFVGSGQMLSYEENLKAAINTLNRDKEICFSVKYAYFTTKK